MEVEKEKIGVDAVDLFKKAEEILRAICKEYSPGCARFIIKTMDAMVTLDRDSEREASDRERETLMNAARGMVGVGLANLGSMGIPMPSDMTETIVKGMVDLTPKEKPMPAFLRENPNAELVRQALAEDEETAK